MIAAVSSVAALAALVLSLVAVGVATTANRRSGNHRRLTASGQEAGGLSDQVDALSSLVGELGGRARELQSRVGELELRADGAPQRAAAAVDPSALRHVAMVRYDAFADVGGRLSYSVAILDDTRSGLVITTLAGKADVRTYVRVISAGMADGSLTAEERQAIDAAVGSEQ